MKKLVIAALAHPMGIPVIFLTARASVDDRVKGLLGGAEDYIVKPFAVAELLARNTITATPDLGAPSTSPFVYKNYQKNVSLQSNKVQSGAGVPSFLVCFELQLASGRVNGTYSVIIEVKGQGTDGTQISQSFTVYVTITDGKDPNATPPPETPTSPPKIIISKYSVNPSAI